MEQDQPSEVVCPYCGFNAELIDSIAVYRKSYGMVWLCQPCQAWVGTHKGSKDHKPLGTLAKLELRTLRQSAHSALDPFWKDQISQGISKGKARREVYSKLAAALGIGSAECHIAMFDEARCREVLVICDGWKRAATEAAAQKDYPLPG